jgi:hypothetical protein
MMPKLVTVTPEIAKKYLEKNVINRPIRPNVVAGLVNIIRHGQFLTTHQGIAFDENGNLLDGQHRLCAIVESGIAVKMWVFTNVPEKQNNIYSMDVIDRGELRCVGDQLTLRHGIKSGRRIAAMLAGIAFICDQRTHKITVPIALEIYNMYKPSVKYVYEQLQGVKVYGSRGFIVGALAFCHNVAPQDLGAFVNQYATGEMLKRGDPALTLRNHVMNSERNTRNIMFAVATTAYYHLLGKPLFVLKQSSAGLNFFKDKQPRMVSKTRSLFGIE